MRKNRAATIGSGQQSHYNKHLRPKKKSDHNEYLRRSWVLDGGKSIENLDQRLWKSRSNKAENRFSMPMFTRSKRDVRESDYISESEFSASLANLDRLQFGGSGNSDRTNFGTVSGISGVPEYSDEIESARNGDDHIIRETTSTLYHKNAMNQPPTHTGSLWCLK